MLKKILFLSCCLFFSQLETKANAWLDSFFQSSNQNIYQSQNMNWNVSATSPTYTNSCYSTSCYCTYYQYCGDYSWNNFQDYNYWSYLDSYNNWSSFDGCYSSYYNCGYDWGSSLAYSYSYSLQFDWSFWQDNFQACVWQCDYDYPQPQPQPQPHPQPKPQPQPREREWHCLWGRCSAPDPVACTADMRYCPNGSEMPRDTKTCRWEEEKCVTDPDKRILEGCYYIGYTFQNCRNGYKLSENGQYCCPIKKKESEECVTNVKCNDGRIVKQKGQKANGMCIYPAIDVCGEHIDDCYCPVGAPNCAGGEIIRTSYTLQCKNGKTQTCEKQECKLNTPKCTWDVNNLIPKDASTGNMKTCNIEGLTAIDNSLCSKEGDSCVSPWIDKNRIDPSLFPTQNAPVVKLFRCACSSGNGGNAWDYQGFASSTDPFPLCPPASSLPGNKVDNAPCQTPDDRCITQEASPEGLRKLFKCNTSSNTSGKQKCALDFNNLVSSDNTSFPTCPEDSTGTVNNVDCSTQGEGWRCKRGTNETFSFRDLQAGSKKVFRCDCN